MSVYLVILETCSSLLGVVFTGYIASVLKHVTATGLQEINSVVLRYFLPCLFFFAMGKMDLYTIDYLFPIAFFLMKIIVTIPLSIICISFHLSLETFIANYLTAALPNAVIIGIPILSRLYGDDISSLIFTAVLADQLSFLPILFISLSVLQVRRHRQKLGGENANLGKSSKIVPMQEHEEITVSDDSIDEKMGFWYFFVNNFLKNPLIISSVGGILWSLSGLEFPYFVSLYLSFISVCVTGVALFTLGSFVHTHSVFSAKKSHLILILLVRHVLSPVVMTLVVYMIGMKGTNAFVAIICCAMPLAFAASIISQQWEVHAKLVASTVVVGTLIVLPVTAFYVFVLSLMPGLDD